MVNTGKASGKAQSGPVKSGKIAVAEQSAETKRKTRSGTKRVLTTVNKESEITKSPPKKAIKSVTNVKTQINKAKEKISKPNTQKDSSKAGPSATESVNNNAIIIPVVGSTKSLIDNIKAG